MGYREEAVPAGSGLTCSWRQAVPVDAERFVQRVVPDGCVDLIWWSRDAELLVAGPDTGPMPTRMEPGEVLVGVRFAPGRAAPVLGVPADALRDARVPLSELWGEEAVRLGELVARSVASTPEAPDVPAPPRSPGALVVPDAGRGTDVLVAAVLERRAGPVDPMVAPAVRGLASGASVRDVADAVGLSERQLRRRALAAFGYGPKVLQRVLRFQRALGAARAGVPAAEAAVDAGYADQAHMAHEVRELAGVPLGTLLGEGG
ncbi:DUF6597 domain-containing transcriptional factor [Actinomadura oligospora]|uniref:DUF6597 domain-containing transcriptional factor n=1 Tax=Actinomadura oligospora TaxID=111804 RepID=UPI00047C1B1F|nr:DUF6597 domain-containing transcriptional factor [Actinomadura oligospora]